MSRRTAAGLLLAAALALACGKYGAPVRTAGGPDRAATAAATAGAPAEDCEDETSEDAGDAP